MGTLGLSLPQMMMGIDKARTDDLACTVDDLGVLIRRVYVRCDVGAGGWSAWLYIRSFRSSLYSFGNISWVSTLLQRHVLEHGAYPRAETVTRNFYSCLGRTTKPVSSKLRGTKEGEASVPSLVRSPEYVSAGYAW